LIGWRNEQKLWYGKNTSQTAENNHITVTTKYSTHLKVD